jgi:hypothetical protein
LRRRRTDIAIIAQAMAAVLGSGTEATVIVAVYVSLTEPDPPGSSAANTCWKDVENVDLKLPVSRTCVNENG